MAILMLTSVVNFGMLIPVAADDVPDGTLLGHVMADNYAELTEAEKEVLKSGLLDADFAFYYTAPTKDDDLVSVNEGEKTVKVSDYTDEQGNLWIPESFDIVVNAEVQDGNDDLALTDENGDGKYEGSYSYNKNAFSVVVTYVLSSANLSVSITPEMQLAMLNAGAALGEDVDYVQKLSKEKGITMNYGGVSMEMTAVEFLAMLTDDSLPIGTLNGGTVVDMLNTYVDGINESYELPNGEEFSVNITLGRKAKDAIKSLVEQQENGDLDLVAFFNANAFKNELGLNDWDELDLVKNHAADFKAALDQNSADIKALIVAGGLTTVSANLGIILEDIPYIEADIYDYINELLAEKSALLAQFGITAGTITSVSDLEALLDQIKAVYDAKVAEASALLEANRATIEALGITLPDGALDSAALADVETQIQAKYDESLTLVNEKITENAGALSGLGITAGTVANAADLAALNAQVETAYAAQLDTLNATIEASGQTALLESLGAPTEVTSAADLTAIIAAFEGYLNGQLGTINGMLAPYASQLSRFGLPTSIAGRADVEALIAGINGNVMIKMVLGSYVPQLEALVGVYDVIDNLKTVEAALIQAEAVIAALAELQAGLETAEYYLGVLDTAVAGLEQAEDAIALLEEAVAKLTMFNEKVAELRTTKTLLDMLCRTEDEAEESGLPVGILTTFCNIAESVVDRFDNDEWNTDLLRANDGYADLSDTVENTDKTYDASIVKELIVKTAEVKYDMSMFNVTVKVNASVVEDAVDSDKLVALEGKTATITLREDVTADEILPFINNTINDALAGWTVIDDNYDCEKSDLDALLKDGALKSDIVFEVNYTPKAVTVTYGEGFDIDSAEYPYGYQMTLEKNPATGKAYSYIVNGERINQGKVITITAPVEISRTAGDANQYKTIVDFIVNTDVLATEDEEAFLQNPALDQGKSFWLVTPENGDELINQSKLFSDFIVTAENVPAEIGDLEWRPVFATTYDEEGNVIESNLVFNGNTVEINDPSYTSIKVSYQLFITTDALESAGVSEEELLDKMNLQKVLADEYAAQKAALNTLLTQNGRLAQIRDNKGALSGALKLAGISPAAVAAINRVINQIDTEGDLKLYTLLTLVDENGDGKVDNMLPYYQRSEEYIAEVNFILDLIEVIENDTVIRETLEEMGKFELFEQLKAQFATLTIPAVNSNISTSDVVNLKLLLDKLEVSNITKEYTSADLMKIVWNASVSAAGEGAITVPVTLNVEGKKPVSTSITLKAGTYITDKTINLINTKIAELEAEYAKVNGPLDKVHYTESVVMPQLGNMVVGGETVSVSWTAKTYTVKIAGAGETTITYANRTVTLPGSGNANLAYVYSYVCGGETKTFDVKVNDVTYTFSDAEFDTVFANGALEITRETIDVARQNLIDLFNEMDGAAILAENNGKYAAVLPVSASRAATDSLTKFVMALFMSNYKYIGIDGQMLYGKEAGASEEDPAMYHLQALIDAVANSGFGTQTVIDVIDDNGQVVQMNLDGYTVLTDKNLNKLGGKLIKTTLSFGSDKDNVIDVDFYVTLAEANDIVLKVEDLLTKAQNYVTVECSDGKVNAEVSLPDQVYAVYVAALSAVGEVNLDDVDSLNNEIAIGYLLTLLEPILTGEVDASTIDNTIAKLGRNLKIENTRYETVYNALTKLYNLAEITYENDVCIVNFNKVSINGIVAKIQPTIDKIAANLGMEAGAIDLAALISEYKDGEEAEGLSLTLSGKLTNVDEEYAALVADVKAPLKDKVHILTADELVAKAPKLAGVSAIVLLDDIDGDLNFKTKTLLDLNGKNVNGSISAKDLVIITDSTGTNKNSGAVSGTVSGRVTVLGGKYASDVSSLLKSGYAQADDGLVYNKAYTIDVENNVVTVTVNATPGELLEFASKTSVASLAIDMAADILVNNYDVAKFSVDGLKIYDIAIEDLINLVAGTNRLDSAIDAVLACVSAPDLAGLFNKIVADVTDFEALNAALEGDGKVASYTATVAPWAFEIEVTEDNYLTANILSSDKTEDYVIELVIDGTYKDDFAVVAGALADTVEITSNLQLGDFYRNSNDAFVLNGSYEGAVKVDFTKDPQYAVMMAVVLAANSNATVKASVVDALNTYYAEHTFGKLEKVFDSVSAKVLCDALANVARGEKFTSMVNSLALSDDAKAAALEIGDDEKGYALVIEALGVLLRQLEKRDLLESVTESGRTLGSIKKVDANGEPYYGSAKGKTFTGNRELYKGYSVDYNLAINELSLDVRIFPNEKAIVVNNAEGKLVGWYNTLSEAFAAVEDGCTMIVVEDVVATENIDLSVAVTVKGTEYIDFAGYSINLVAAGAQIAADADIKANVTCADGLCFIVDGFTYSAVLHDYVADVTDPTCDADGFTTYTCKVCGDSYVADVVPAAHTDVVYVEAIDPKCHYTGNVEYWVCNACDTVALDADFTQISNRKNVILPRLLETADHYKAKAATCLELGNIEYWHCAECDQYWADAALTIVVPRMRVLIPVLDHTIVEVEAIDPACHYTGNIAYKYCTVCDTHWTMDGRLTNRKDVILPRLSNEATYVKAVEAT
ncbi:MAG: hypothetical protein IJC50_03775, partial [Clostridia bacterium]|nr:hypothetical protein [Clostridia bacterium]